MIILSVERFHVVDLRHMVSMRAETLDDLATFGKIIASDIPCDEYHLKLGDFSDANPSTLRISLEHLLSIIEGMETPDED